VALAKTTSDSGEVEQRSGMLLQAVASQSDPQHDPFSKLEIF
jgi:hypothetical protein